MILIGDAANRHLARWSGVQYVNWQDHANRAEAFKSVYHHASSLGEVFELICIQRWMVLCDFLKSRPKGLQHAIHLDSDILVYADFEHIETQARPFPLTILACSGHTSFVNEVSWLERFCSFIEAHYTESWGKERLEAYRQRWFRAQGAMGNVSDMTFLLAFHLQHPREVRDLTGPVANGWALDQTLDSSHGGYAMRNGIKEIHWKNGIPCVRHLPTNQEVQFLTLHFQGASKGRMKQSATLISPMDRFLLAANGLVLNGQRVLRRLKALS